MTIRTVLVVILALVVGSAAALGVGVLRNATRTPKNTVPVVVTATDVPRFSTITKDMVQTRHYPKELVPPGSFGSVEDVHNRVALTSLSKGEALLDNRLTPVGSGRGLAAAIPPGLRAITICTPTIASAVGGFIIPGSKVDVLLTVTEQDPKGPTGGSSTTTLLQAVEVLAVDQRVDATAQAKVEPNKQHSVTLLVTPDQANELDLGQNKGILHLTLRNPDDRLSATGRPVTLRDLRLHREPVDSVDLQTWWRSLLRGELKPTVEVAVAPPPREVPIAAPALVIAQVAVPTPVAVPVAPPPTRVYPPPPVRTLRGVTPGVTRAP